MTRWLALCVFALGCLWCRSVLADETAPVMDIPIRNAWKEADDAGQYRDQIGALIQQEVAKLCKPTDDATAGPTISGARQWLVNERRLASNPDATTASYLDVYSGELNKAFVKALGQPDLSVNARVNIGIITKMVTEDAQTDNMLGTALALMKDKSDAVVLWGQRAALNLLRLSLGGGTLKPGDCDQLRDGIIDAVRSHQTPPMGAILAFEAYWGLNPENFPHVNPLPADGMQCLILANLGIQEARLQLYKNGSAPDQPEVDTHPSEFLLDAKNWTSMTGDEPLRAMQCASDLIAYAGERAANLPSNENRDLINGIKHEAYYVQGLVDAHFNKNAEVDAVLARVASLPIASRPDSIREACRAVYPALNSLDAFSALKRPDIGHAQAPGVNLNDVKTAGVTGQGG